MIDNNQKTQTNKHIKKGDLIAIAISLALAVFTFITGSGYFGGYYLAAALFRLFVIGLQFLRVRNGDTPEKKFKKERRLCRLAGVIFFLMSFYTIPAFIATIKKEPSTFFVEFQFFVLIYAFYAFYKLFSGYIYLRKSRLSWSPYREILCNLSFYEGMMTLFNVEVLIFSITDKTMNEKEVLISSLTVSVISIISIVLAIKMIRSRRLPNLIKQ